MQGSSKNYDEIKLANWLKKIYPQVAEELEFGLTSVFNDNSTTDDLIRVQPHQILQIDNKKSKGHLNSIAIWLSVQTSSAPSLVISSTPSHESWCEHTENSLQIYSPKRSANGLIFYSKVNEIAVKSCITVLATNPYDKDYFAGGAISGDLYVWQYNPSSNTVTEHFNESLNQSTIIGIAWIKMSSVNSENAFLTCHTNGHISLWKCGSTIINERNFRITSRNRKNETVNLSAIATLNGLEFVVGSEEGKLFLCSASQLLPIRDAKNTFDPVMTELESHKFSVTSIALANLNGKNLLVTSDFSGEIFAHDIESNKANEPSVIIKLPLPFKNKIGCTKDLKNIFSPGNDGALEIYNIGNGETMKIASDACGKGNMIAVTDNGQVDIFEHNDLFLFELTKFKFSGHGLSLELVMANLHYLKL